MQLPQSWTDECVQYRYAVTTWTDACVQYAITTWDYDCILIIFKLELVAIGEG